MVQDIQTVVWKELKELWLASLSKGSMIRTLLWVGIFGAMLPAQHGVSWLSSPLTLYFWVWFPMLFVSAAVTGAFAREREHHTLETLLATRLPDAAILLGKMLAGVLYGWGLDVVCVVLGWVVANVVSGTGGVHFYDLSLLVGGLVTSFLGAGLVSGVGVLISMDAPTFQSAARGITIVVLLLFVPVLALDYLPEGVVAPVFSWLAEVDLVTLTGVSSGLLLFADGALLWAARARFQRTALLMR